MTNPSSYLVGLHFIFLLMSQNNQPNIDSSDKNLGARGARVSTRNQRRRTNRRNNMSNLVSNEINNPSYNLVRGQDLDKLVKLAADKNGFQDYRSKTEIRDYMRNMSAVANKSKTKSKLLRQAILAFDIKKLLSMPKYAEMDRSAILSLLSKDATAISASTGITKDQAYELIALDDFSDFMDTVSTYLPVLSPYTDVVKTAYNVGSSIYNGVKNYMTPSDRMNEKTTVMNTKVNASNDRSLARSSLLDKTLFDPNRVDVPSILAVICPSKYKLSTRFDDVQPSAILTGFFEIPVIPDATTGAAFVAIFPGNAAFVGSTYSFILYSDTGSAYNPTTGAYNATYVTSQASSLSYSSTSITAGRPVGLSAYYKSTVQNSTTYAVGQVDLYHDPASAGVSFATPSTALALNNIGYKPFYQRGAVTDSFTQVFYNPLDNYPFVSATDGLLNTQAPIVFVFSGCNTSGVQVGTIVVHATWNVVPTSAGLSQLPVSAPGVGPATNALLDTMFTVCPEVFMNDIKCNMDLCKKLSSTEPTYASLLEVLINEDYTHRQYFGTGNASGAMMGSDISFDKL
jgi:hypothetical protein